MATTYTLIDSEVLTSSAASVTFSSIPATYTDLVVRISGRTDVNNNNTYYQCEFNASTANFTYRQLYADGTSAGSSSGTFGYFGVTSGAADVANVFGNAEIYIPNYAGSTNKPFSVFAVQEDNASEVYMSAIAGLRSNTDAITSIKIKSATGNLVSGSSFYLYGISNA
jgi:hypothetical protein